MYNPLKEKSMITKLNLLIYYKSLIAYRLMTIKYKANVRILKEFSYFVHFKVKFCEQKEKNMNRI